MDAEALGRKLNRLIVDFLASCRPIFVIVLTLVLLTNSSSVSAFPWRQKIKACADLMTDKPTSIKWLSKHRFPDIEKAYKILNSWKSMSLSEYRSFFKSNPDATVFVRVIDAEGRPIGVLGDVELFELTDSYAIFAIRDSQGRIHAVDLEQKDLVVQIPNAGASDEIDFIDRFSEKAFFKVDLSKLHALVSDSSQAIKAYSDFNKVKNLLESSVDAARFSKVQKIYTKIGQIASYSVWPVIIFWGGSTIARSLSMGADNFVLQHASNFYFGLVGMALVHANLSAIWPNKRFSFLSATVLTNFAFNVIEEVDFGVGRISNGAFGQLGTDWLDFSSGMLSAAVYLSVVGMVESINHVQNSTNPNRIQR